MTRTLLKTLFCLALATCFVGSAFGQVTLTITAPNPDWYSLGGIYTNPYTFDVGGATGVLLSCDDFFDDVYLGESWKAQQTALSTIENETSLNTTVYFPGNSSQAQNLPDNGTNPVQQQQFGYEEIAYLAANLYYNASADDWGNPTAAQLSYAIWDIYDPSLLANNTQNLDSADLTAARNDVTAAQTFVKNGGTVGSALIFTPMCGSSVCTTQTSGAPQEFIEVLSPNSGAPMPEPSLVAFLAVDLIFVLALVARWRRRTFTN